jgi:predicted RNase H-like nuclease (RuvC/YqgF family)
MNKLIENMETKLFRLRKDLNDAHDKINFLINDLNKLKKSEDLKTEVEGGKNE